ncbi:MAG: hypothetical protein U1E61_06695 [Bradyrhizobium sp.]
MTKAIEHIANGLLRLRDRTALQRMREHRAKLLQDYQKRPLQALTSKALETALEDDISVLDEALSRLSDA